MADPKGAEAERRAFGMAVRIWRIRRSWSQRELADRARLDRTHLSRIEQGEGDAAISTQGKLAAALGATVYDLWAMARDEDHAGEPATARPPNMN